MLEFEFPLTPSALLHSSCAKISCSNYHKRESGITWEAKSDGGGFGWHRARRALPETLRKRHTQPPLAREAPLDRSLSSSLWNGVMSPPQHDVAPVAEQNRERMKPCCGQSQRTVQRLQRYLLAKNIPVERFIICGPEALALAQLYTVLHKYVSARRTYNWLFSGGIPLRRGTTLERRSTVVLRERERSPASCRRAFMCFMGPRRGAILAHSHVRSRATGHRFQRISTLRAVEPFDVRPNGSGSSGTLCTEWRKGITLNPSSRKAYELSSSASREGRISCTSAM